MPEQQLFTLPWRVSRGASVRSFQIHLSNSPRASTHIHTDVIHRPCYCVGVGAALVSLSPHKREGAERRLALLHSLAPRRRCRVPCGHAASRRSTVASSTPGPCSSGPNRRLSPPRSGRLSPPFIRTVPAFLRRQPFVVRADGNPGRPGPPVHVHRGAGATPAPSTKTPLEDALTEQACRQYRGLRTAQD